MSNSEQCKCGRPLLPEETTCPNCRNRGAKKAAKGGMFSAICAAAAAVVYAGWNNRVLIKEYGKGVLKVVRDNGLPMAVSIFKSVYGKK